MNLESRAEILDEILTTIQELDKQKPQNTNLIFGKRVDSDGEITLYFDYRHKIKEQSYKDRIAFNLTEDDADTKGIVEDIQAQFEEINQKAKKVFG